MSNFNVNYGSVVKHTTNYSTNQAESLIQQAIEKEFLEKSAIALDVFRANVEFIPDLEIDPVTREILSTPIDDFLGRAFTRFTRKAKPSLIAAKFGEWQLKIYGADGDGKRTGDYQAPTGIGDKPFLPNIPARIANKIIAKYCTPSVEAEWLAQESLDFWEFFVNHPEIPLIVTEGAKKALAAISQGHIALALFGVNCGVTDLTVKPELLPYIQNREVTIAFDRDTKPETRHKVFRATKKLGNAITYHAKGTVKIATWDGKLAKGLDDLVAHDPESFHAAIANAQDFSRWKLGQYTDLSELVSRRVNVPNLTALTIPDEAKLICLKSPKKTYKTELLARDIQKAINAGIPVFVFSHREQLVKELARRFCLEYRTELTKEGKLFGYCLCVDSAHPNANPPLYGDAPEWEDCWIVFDECEQVFWHLLSSDTCQYNRPAILKTITSLVNRASRVFLADADLTRVSIDYVNSMRDKDRQLQPYLVVNEYKHPSRNLYTFDKAKYLFSKILELLADGQKLMIHTGGQIAKSDWGTTNLETLITRKFPSLKVLRIDKITVSDPTHPAYGCVGNLNQILPNYDVVICSPTIETGVSVEVEHFDAVCCFASGSQTVEAIGQTVERVRSDVPRYLWASEKAHWNKIGSGATDVYKVLSDDKKLAKVNGYLTKIDDFFEIEDDLKTRHRKTWAIMAARHNLGFQTYRQSIYDLLSSEFTLHNGTLRSSDVEIDLTKQEAQTTAEENHLELCQKVTNAELLTDAEYKAIREKRFKTESERLSEQKTAIAQRYATNEVTPDLVNKDSDFNWYRQLRLHYFLSVGSEFLLSRDFDRVSGLAKNTGKVFSPDANRACLAATVKALEAINIKQFLDPDKTWTKFDLEDWRDDLIAKRRDIKTFLNVTVSPNRDDRNNGPIRLAQRLLAKMGLALIPIAVARVNGEPTKIYRLASRDPDGRAAIFERWELRDRGKLEQKNVVWNAIDNIPLITESQTTPHFKPGDRVGCRGEDWLLEIVAINNVNAILKFVGIGDSESLIELATAYLIPQEGNHA